MCKNNRITKYTTLSCGLILSIVCGILVSCNSNKRDVEVESIALTGTKLSLDEDFPTTYGNGLIGDYFLSQPYMTNNIIYVGKITPDSIVSMGSYLHKGNGPGEYQEVSVITKNDSTLLVLNSKDSFPVSMTTINPDSLIAGKPTVQIVLDNQNTDPFRGAPFSTTLVGDDKLLINSGWYDKGNILTLFDLTTNKSTLIDWLPDDGFTGPALPKAFVYMDNSRLLSSGNRICYVSGNGKIVMIFQLENDKLVPLKTIYNELPDYWVAEDGINYYQRLTTDALKPASTDNHIFLLNKKYTMEGKLAEGDREPRVFGNIVEVFNWDGEPVCNLTLDQHIISILVSSDGKSLYGTSQNKETGEYEIFRFPLPDIPH